MNYYSLIKWKGSFSSCQACFVFLIALITFLIICPSSTSIIGQSLGRRVTTLQALATYPLFFHSEEVVIHGTLDNHGNLAYLAEDETKLLVLGIPPESKGATELLEVTGTYYDIGRLEPNNPRVNNQLIKRLSETLLNKPWPGTGELPLLIASSIRPAPIPTDISLRTIALDPKEFLDQDVTVIGRFRGRNLYGDLPESPGESPWDFVLVSVDAAVWIVGKEPKGDDFTLDIQSRIDTGRWLQVTGELQLNDGMVVLAAKAIALADPIEDTQDRPIEIQANQKLIPEVIFSAPLPNDSNVPQDTKVRIQFSKDMDPSTFVGQIRITLPEIESSNPKPLLKSDYKFKYLNRNRVLEIEFIQTLKQLQTVNVELLNEIASIDGMALKPWSLSFLIGG